MASPKITHIGLVDPTLDPLNTRTSILYSFLWDTCCHSAVGYHGLMEVVGMMTVHLVPNN
jgi:hypothetical protein